MTSENIKLPHIPLDVADTQSELEGMTLQEAGTYFHLLLRYWQRGPIPNDPKILSLAIGGTQWSDGLFPLEKYFELKDGCWFCDWLDRLLAEKREAYEKFVKGGRNSAESRRRARLNREAASQGA